MARLVEPCKPFCDVWIKYRIGGAREYSVAGNPGGEQIIHELYESPGKGPDYLHILPGERRDDHFGNRLFNCLHIVNVDVDSVKAFAVTVNVSSLCGHKALQLVGD
ncbi:hypothetical protein DPMN_072455 [Dreissena polymorpha]|uniref:Uncharacterized protein n=1 Tax=Dreissena polymorpha TaxID=45954 RepID=A0A9D3Z892_DREPO|nr:hypothetical protein DPMN_072455 [Dreissena polymorpha]